jgi:4-aminobutyrate aminotransferase / (S)-3-amino-2-methylpropionate transaminase / 5-aminovalerate transaminase
MWSVYFVNLDKRRRIMNTDGDLPYGATEEDLQAGQHALMNGWRPDEKPVVLVRGSGCFVWDSAGHRYLDCISQAWALNVGHCHPRVLEAADRQARTLSHVRNNFGNVPLLLLAKRLSELLPGRLKRVAFSLHGSTAVETAMKLAIRNTPGGGAFVTLYDAYHGRTLGAMSLSWPHPHNPSVAWQRESIRVPQAYCYRCPLQLRYPSCGIACADLVRTAMRKAVNGKPTAMIMEPIQGNGAQTDFPIEYLRAIRQICDEEEVLLIWDEVQSAFGRIPAMFAADYYAVTPDLLVFGKALGGGYPLAGVGMREDLQEFDGGEDALTFGHFPVSAAAALATLDVLEEEGLFENCERQGAYLTARLKEMQQRYELIGDVRGPGLAIGVELVRDRETKEPAYEETTRFCDLAMERGVIFGSTRYRGMGNVVKVKPPATISRDEADLALEVFESVLHDVSKERVHA